LTKRDPNAFELRPREYYPTIDPKAHKVIAPLVKGRTYAEPCYGAGDLVRGISGENREELCKFKSDISPDGGGCLEGDALDLIPRDLESCDLIVTNPPFDRKTLVPLLEHFISLKPTWLLLPADRMHVKYFSEYMDMCTQVHSIGRLCWFYKEGKRVAGVDNYAWFFWPKGGDTENPTIFRGIKDEVS